MEIIVYNKTTAELTAAKLNKVKNGRYAFISITTPGYGIADIHKGGAVVDIFRMSFYDVELNVSEKFQCAKRSDIEGLKNFIDNLKDIDVLIVHCSAGISRSAAVAAAIELYLDMEDTIWCSKQYFPNNHVYRLCLDEFGILKTEDYYYDLFSNVVKN